MRQGLTSVRLLQMEQKTMRCFTSRIAVISRSTLRRLVPDARESFQFVDKFGDWLSVFQHVNLVFGLGTLVFAETSKSKDPRPKTKGDDTANREGHPAQAATFHQVYPSWLRPLCGSLR